MASGEISLDPGRKDNESKALRMARVMAECSDRMNEGEILGRKQIIQEYPDVGSELLKAIDVLRDCAPDLRHDSPLDQLGNYRILREVGRGGMGVVYEAIQSSTDRRVALKVLPASLLSDPKAVARFQREGRISSSLDHPGICAVYDAGVEKGIPYIAMRYIEGETLATKIHKSKEIPSTCCMVAQVLEESPDAGFEPKCHFDRHSAGLSSQQEIRTVVQLVERVARALHVAHEAGLVHRDIKPGNIIITKEGDPVILDFGLALGQGRDVTTQSDSGSRMGTPAYMAPEQIASSGARVDRRTDVYSLGATLYECLTLRPPFYAATREGLFRKILYSSPQDPRMLNRQMSRDLKVVLETALEKNQDRRYQTALDFAEELRRIRSFEPIQARPAGPMLLLQRWTQRNPSLATAILSLFFFLIVGLTVSLWLLKQVSDEKQAKEHLLAALQKEQFDELDKMIGRSSGVDFVTISSEKLSLLFGAQASSPETFSPESGKMALRKTFGIYAHEMPTVLAPKFARILAALEQRMTESLSRPVRLDLIIFRSYEIGRDALVNHQVDFMRVGPASYVLAKNKDPRVLLLALQEQDGKPEFKGFIFTRKDSGVRSLQDLKGKRFAFGDPESTVGRYLAQKALVKAGIYARDIHFEYLQHHDAVVDAVRQGRFDAGAAKEGALLESGDKDLKVLAEVTTVCMPWVARGGLDAEVTRSFKKSLVAFKDPKILGPLKDKVTGFREATDEMFHQTRADIDDSRPFEGSDPPPVRNFKRGDVNADGAINLSDAVFVLDYLFLGKSAPGCLKSADSNVSGSIDLIDPIFLLNHLFLGGPAPSEPFLACGIDPTQDFLTCTAYPPCP